MWVFWVHQPEKYLISEGERKGNKEKGRGSKKRKKTRHTTGAPNENIVQNHLNIALLNLF